MNTMLLFVDTHINKKENHYLGPGRQVLQFGENNYKSQIKKKVLSLVKKGAW
jgi:hypothetical protein